MDNAEKISAITKLLIKRDWDEESAREAAKQAIEASEPVLESLCIQELAEHLSAPIHKTEWITHRAENPSSDAHNVIKRLIDSGASPDHLAVFARMMQREYLSNLGCILDGAGIHGTPSLPFEDFRIFAVDDAEDPQSRLDELHESLGWAGLEKEMQISKEAASRSDKE
jgi:hypothetical protein